MQSRCAWAGNDPLYQSYHDEEWGVPLHDDHKLFELLILEGAQAGLSWITVLRKRQNYRQLFADFDPVVVARLTPLQLEEILKNPGIIRNRLKVYGTVQNAQAFLKVQQEFDSFDRFIWSFVNGTPMQNRWERLEDVPAISPEAVAMSKELKRRGFTFVGPTICYAFMQACGMVNDHTIDCFRHRELGGG
ncbi:MAG TPA: DNA-3-methyladenine glycosylase I [Geobacterales bacterium]|nr:DNA-3-methyladenine glycosylase I [Geobacterales bacterium]